MEPGTIYLIFTLLFILFAIGFLSLIKVVFSHVQEGITPVETETERWIFSQIEREVENPSAVALTISFAKSVYSTALAICLFFILSDLLELTTIWLSLLSITVSALLISIPGYIIPRALATAQSNNFLISSFFFYRINAYIYTPPVLLMNLVMHLTYKIVGHKEHLHFLTREEKNKLDTSTPAEGSLDHEEREMIRNIFDLNQTAVHEIMVPRVDIEGLPVDISYSEMLTKISQMGHSRIPVFENSIDNIIGILYVKDIINWLALNKQEEWNLRAIMRKPHYIPANKLLDDLMRDMKTTRSHIVVIVDEYGGTAGLVTMEDILEEIVGEINDEYDDDSDNPVKKIGDNTFIVDPHIELDDLMESIGIPIELENSEYNTLGGLFYHEYGDVPEEGTLFQFKTLELKILKMENQRIAEIQLTLPADRGSSEIDTIF